MPTFLQKYLEHTQIYESPNSFWKWSAYAAISAVLRDNCFKRQGDSAIFPNVYILFLAESSGHRKGRPIELCESLVYKVNNTKIISGRASVQAILDELSRGETDKDTGKIIKGGSAIFIAPELAAGIVSDPEAMKILTDIYDYKSNPYKSRLRTGPSFNIERIVFSILAASNEDMIKDLFNSTVVKGGMLARTFLIIPNEFRPSNSLMRIDMEERKSSFTNVLKSLEEISRLRGEFIFEDDAILEYEEWYNPFRQSYKAKKESSGIVGRIHTGALKIAMLIAANHVSLQVTKEHMEEAINECLKLIPNYSAFTMGNGKSTISNAGGMLLADLLEAKGKDYKLTRKEVIRNHWQDFDAEILDKLILNLEISGIIRQITSGSTITYQLTAEGLDKLGIGK